jgi:hypothetical protein
VKVDLSRRRLFSLDRTRRALVRAFGGIRKEGPMRGDETMRGTIVSGIALSLAMLLPAGAGGAGAADCLLDGNPTCASATQLGQLAGDAGTPRITRTGIGEAFFVLRLREESSSSRDLTAAVRLQVPPGMNYDLVVRCDSCASSVAKTSTSRQGQSEEVRLSRRDDFDDNSFSVIVEVRYRQGKSCAPWTLTFVGNSGPGTSPLVCG